MSRKTRQPVCEWCLLPKFGETRCICDSPKFTEMAICDGCGEWTDVDRLFAEEWDADDQYCFDCSLQTAPKRGEPT